MTITIKRGSSDLLLADKHAPYIPDAESNFDLYTAQVEYEWRLGRYVYDFSERKKHVLKDGSSWWFPSVPEIDATNAHYLEVLNVAPGDRVWDIGAYSGRSSVAFADRASPHGQVVALEPDPTNYSCLVMNLIHRHDITLRNEALWDLPGKVMFEADGQMGSGITAPRSECRVYVPTVTPKTLMGETFAPTVVKLDIEGAEYRVVPAFADIFPTARPRFLIECHHHEDLTGFERLPQLEEFFTEHDYQTSVVDQPEANPFPLLHAVPR